MQYTTSIWKVTEPENVPVEQENGRNCMHGKYSNDMIIVMPFVCASKLSDPPKNEILKQRVHFCFMYSKFFLVVGISGIWVPKILWHTKILCSYWPPFPVMPFWCPSTVLGIQILHVLLSCPSTLVNTPPKIRSWYYFISRFMNLHLGIPP